jgi:filamentous hemagglutinin
LDPFNIENNPNIRILPPGSKAFDRFDVASGEAISRKSLYSRGDSYRRDPRTIYARLKGYVDKAADYDTPRAKTDLDPADIKSRTLQLAIPIKTTPVQWLEINRAILYGRGRGVKVHVIRTIK